MIIVLLKKKKKLSLIKIKLKKEWKAERETLFLDGIAREGFTEKVIFKVEGEQADYQRNEVGMEEKKNIRGI